MQENEEKHLQAKQNLRFPIDLICVIDTSGSMNGEKLSLLKNTLLFLLEQMKEKDRISLI